MRIGKQTMAILALAVLLVAALAYIGFGRYIQSKQQKELATFQQGAQYGYSQAIAQLMHQAATCQQVPVSLQNQTLNLIAVECLQQKKG